MEAHPTTPARALTRAAALCTALLAGTAAAQEDPTPQERPPLERIGRPPQEPQRVLLEQVIGVVGDKAILESQVRAELLAWIEGEKNRTGERPRAQAIDLRSRQILIGIESREALAQAARALPDTTRERIDALVSQWLDDQRKEDEERAGSINKLRDELGILGQTYESQQEELKTERLAALAVQENMQRRWHDQLYSLAVTPTEMRRYYDEHIDEFVGEASADLEVVAFETGADPDAARARAAEAAAAWRTGALTADQIAERFGGYALSPRANVRDVPADPNLPAIKAFAGGAAQGDVSDPIPLPGLLWLLRVTERREARNQRFEDREVQAAIHQTLVLDRIDEERRRLVLKSRKRFEPVRPRRR